MKVRDQELSKTIIKEENIKLHLMELFGKIKKTIYSYAAHLNLYKGKNIFKCRFIKIGIDQFNFLLHFCFGTL